MIKWTVLSDVKIDRYALYILELCELFIAKGNKLTGGRAAA